MRACVGLGSNLGDRLGMLRAARDAIDRDPDTRVVAASFVYETEPVGPEGQGPYLNAALTLETGLAPRDLLELLLSIERRMGRDRGADAVRWGPRVIDLDVLLVEQERICEPGLEVPHPRLHERAFVLVPLADVAPSWLHPVLRRTIGELATEAPGRGDVARAELVGPDWWALEPAGDE